MKADLNKADLKIHHVRVFNSYFKRFDDADVYIKDGKFLYIDRKQEDRLAYAESVEGNGQVMIPGLIDIHMHIESSMVTPSAFLKYTAAHGLTTIVAEPHEIANVAGKKGIEAMMQDAEGGLYDAYFAIPSNVPIMPEEFETSGGKISCEDMLELKEKEGIICLGEVMNFREIIQENTSEVGKFIDLVHDADPLYPLEGHCPSLIDLDLAKFLYLGIASDHTDHNIEELKQRFENGMFIQLQDIMITPEVIDFIRNNNLYAYFSFVTDDTLPDVLCEKGHLDALLRKAIRLGMDPVYAIYCATYTPAERMRLRDRGVIAPGKLADFVLLDRLEDLHILSTYKKGKRIFAIDDEEDEREDYSLDGAFEHTVYSRYLTEDDFKVRLFGKDRIVSVRVMEVNPYNNRTEEIFVDMEVKDGQLEWHDTGCALCMVIERHNRDNHISYGFLKGASMKRGAAATSYAHDSHNLLVAGMDERDMMMAINRIIEMQGGITAVLDGELIAEICLPIAGLLSKKSVRKTAEEFVKIREAFSLLGYEHYNSVMNFSLLTLTCVNSLKLTDRGYMDTVHLKMVPLFEEKEEK